MMDDPKSEPGPLGTQLVGELARRGEKGMYFSFEQYQELGKVQDTQGLERFLTSVGYPTVVASDDLVQVANGLREAKEFDDLPSIFISDPTGILGLLGTVVWFLYRKLRRKPKFPSKHSPAGDYNGNLLEG